MARVTFYNVDWRCDVEVWCFCGHKRSAPHPQDRAFRLWNEDRPNSRTKRAAAYAKGAG